MTSYNELTDKYSLYENYTYRDIENGLIQQYELSADFSITSTFTATISLKSTQRQRITTSATFDATADATSKFRYKNVLMCNIQSTTDAKFIFVMKYRFMIAMRNTIDCESLDPIIIDHTKDRYVTSAVKLQKEYNEDLIITKEYNTEAIINKEYDANLVLNVEHTAKVTLNIA